MRTGITTLLIGSLFPVIAMAQPPPPVTRGYYSPAYRHFLRSQSPVKTYSSYRSGERTETVTPFSYESRYVDPSYEHQRVDPFGFEHRYRLPGYGADYADPYQESGFYQPGQDVRYRIPFSPVPRPYPPLGTMSPRQVYPR